MLILAGISLIFVATIVSFSGTIAVGQDGYPPDGGHSVGDASVSPSSGACRGQQILVTGSGAAGNSIIEVSMITNGWSPERISIPEIPSAKLGTIVSNAYGDWSLFAVVPHEATTWSSPTPPTQSGLWAVYATWLPNNAGYTVKQGALNVLDCTVSDALELPSTGSSAIGLYIAGGCLLLVTGMFLRASRQKV